MALFVPITDVKKQLGEGFKLNARDDMRYIFGTFRVEDYHDIIPTYKTSFIRIKKKHSEALMKKYESTHKPFHELVFKETHSLALQDLEEQIKRTISSDFKDDQVFVRLSTRSPKDSIIHAPNFEELLTHYVERYHPNDVLAVLKTQHDLDGCKNSMDVLFKLCNSKRVYEDLLMSNLFNEDNNKIKDEEAFLNDQQVLLRFFDTKLTPELELRCFVPYDEKEEKYKLSAITQYYKLLYVEYLHKNKERILDNVLKCFEKLFDSLLERKFKQSFVIDIGLDYEHENVAIIELNPFSARTGPCLFDWKKDRETLEGHKEFEFRVREEPISVEEQRGSLLEAIRLTLEKIKPLEKKVEVGEIQQQQDDGSWWDCTIL